MSHKMSGRLSTFSLSLVFCSFVVLDVRGFETFSRFREKILYFSRARTDQELAGESQSINHLRIASGFAGQIVAASSTFMCAVPVIVISACTDSVPIDDVEDPRVRHVAVLSRSATAKFLF